MSNDFNEFFAINPTSSLDIFTPDNVFEPQLDDEYNNQPLEFNDFDLEIIEPYDVFGLSIRKNSIKERFTTFDTSLCAKRKEDENLNDVSFTTFDRTDLGNQTPKICTKNNKDNVFDQSFISDIDPKPLAKRERLTVSQISEPGLNKEINPNPLYKSEINHKDTKRIKKRSKENEDPKPPLKSCKCNKSKCLRLYCECFAKGMVCGVDCNCTDCHNTEQHKPLRELVIQETLEKNPYAFKSKYKRLDRKDSILHSRGCNCSKTGCVKEYCECFKAGTGCSRLCRCSNCLNQKIEIEADEVKIYYDRVLRKRRKRSVLKECFINKLEILRKMSLNFN